LKKILIIILFPLNFLYALEVTCNFEEVYQNSEVQQGVFLIKDKMLRYQYYDQDLFTIIIKDNNYFLINNRTNIVQNLKEKSETLDQLIEIVSDFPNINSIYNSDNMIIKIEKSSSMFIKRVSVKSEELNLSINIMNCNFDKIDKKYFRHFNFQKYIN
tara:strand:- start:886 stop:1359 length:474 start_codon:yes stop_codon:yes gene_type:complete